MYICTPKNNYSYIKKDDQAEEGKELLPQPFGGFGMKSGGGQDLDKNPLPEPVLKPVPSITTKEVNKDNMEVLVPLLVKL